ncbi:galactonate dehydratase [Oscillibacter sp. PC13]|jgi:L-alanine-DL-glutamate epimerase-like enolase superfamily enzyme|uniref:mandelate racemase/muconate lactonizing enzyme family protein n=1 Tax=Oscillibacter sp. PC13 TaxID=1855299 RepID=UPI0008E0647B|nr:mandelate racemase/muconate lactonizing enzyme family protein [Oscillibacter sp. PC13]SFQ00110.1 galactonate dehydratase [Oscillibacter sp. PC13]
MKIRDIKTYPLMYMKPSPKLPRTFILVKVETDEGIFGWGEASSAYGHSFPMVVKEIIDGTFKRILVGEDPLQIERLVTKMRTYIWGYLGSNGVSCQAISAVEIALWDILGKVAGLPVYKLLGADKDRVKVYATGAANFTVDYDWHMEFFERNLREGYTGVKVRVGKSKDWDEEFVRRVRELVGPDINVMIDAYMTYKPDTAIEMANRFAPYKPYFYEEPLSQYDLSSLERISRISPVPIALGERVCSLYAFKELVERKIGNIFQPDATIVGGIKECLAVCTMAEAFSIPCIPHIGGCAAVGYAANLHVALASRNVSMLELDGADYQPMRDEILVDPIFDATNGGVLKDGTIHAPEKPGLGIDINEEAFEKFPYTRGITYNDVFPQYGAGIV